MGGILAGADQGVTCRDAALHAVLRQQRADRLTGTEPPAIERRHAPTPPFAAEIGQHRSGGIPPHAGEAAGAGGCRTGETASVGRGRPEAAVGEKPPGQRLGARAIARRSRNHALGTGGSVPGSERGRRAAPGIDRQRFQRRVGGTDPRPRPLVGRDPVVIEPAAQRLAIDRAIRHAPPRPRGVDKPTAVGAPRHAFDRDRRVRQLPRPAGVERRDPDLGDAPVPAQIRDAPPVRGPGGGDGARCADRHEQPAYHRLDRDIVPAAIEGAHRTVRIGRGDHQRTAIKVGIRIGPAEHEGDMAAVGRHRERRVGLRSLG